MTALQPMIGSRILLLREPRVMLDADLAELYGVQTKVLVQAVKRYRAGRRPVCRPLSVAMSLKAASPGWGGCRSN